MKSGGQHDGWATHSAKAAAAPGRSLSTSLTCCEALLCHQSVIPGRFVLQVFPDARSRNARLGFALIYPDRHGRNVMRVVRVSPLHCASGHLTPVLS